MTRKKKAPKEDPHTKRVNEMLQTWALTRWKFCYFCFKPLTPEQAIMYQGVGCHLGCVPPKAERVYNDPPPGRAWACLGCNSWATLKENANAHMWVTGHPFPVLTDISVLRRPPQDDEEARCQPDPSGQCRTHPFCEVTKKEYQRLKEEVERLREVNRLNNETITRCASFNAKLLLQLHAQHQDYDAIEKIIRDGEERHIGEEQERLRLALDKTDGPV